MKVIRCKDSGADCDFEARAETTEKIMEKVAEHARIAHGMTEVTPEMAEKVRGLIREE
jgi:predicted small metal-binding protein